MGTHLTLEGLNAIAADLVSILGEYPYIAGGEAALDRFVYAYLRGRFSSAASRQWPALPVRGRAGRIDFRVGGNNPVVFELAVRTPETGNLGVGSNKPELRKLSRVPQAKARVRALLLLDLKNEPVNFEMLRERYQAYHLGKGKFDREPVSVVYAHATTQHRFIWSPFK